MAESTDRKIPTGSDNPYSVFMKPVDHESETQRLHNEQTQELRQINANLVSVIGLLQSVSAMMEMALDEQQGEDPQNPRTL